MTSWPLDFERLFAKLDETSLRETIEVLDSEPPSSELDALRHALVLSAAALDDDPFQLASQIVGRIDPVRFPALQTLVAGADAWREYAWLKPLTRELIQLGGAIAAQLYRHQAGVRSIVVSADDRLAVSTSDDTTVWIWDITTGVAIHRLTRHRKGVITGVLTPDSRRVLTIGQDHVLYVWDTETGQPVGSLAGVACWRNSLALLDGGRRAVVGTITGTLVIIDTETGQVDSTLSGHRGEISAVLASADGRRIYSSSKGDALRIWDVQSRDELARIPGRKAQVLRAAISRDGSRIVTCMMDHSIQVRGAVSGELLHTFDEHTKRVVAIVVTDDGRFAISAGQESDRAIRVWDLDTGCQAGRIDSLSSTTHALVLLPGSRFATGSDDGVTRVWTLPGCDLIGEFDAGQRAIRSLAVTSDGERLLAGDDDGSIITWCLNENRAVANDVRVAAPPSSWGKYSFLQATADGQFLVSAPGGASVTGWDTTQARPRWSIEQLTAPLTALTFDASSGCALWGDASGRLTRARIDDGEIVAKTQLHSDRITALALDADMRLGVTASRDRTARVFDLDTIETLATHTGPVASPTALLVTPRVAQLVTGSLDGNAAVWDAVSGTLIHRLRGHTSPVRDIQASSDGRTIVTSSNDGAVIGWDRLSGAQLFTLDTSDGTPAKRSAPAHLILAHSSSMLYAIRGGRIGVWDLDEGRMLRQEWHDGRTPTAIAGAPDGTRFVTLAADRVIRLWDVETLSLVASVTIDERPIQCVLTGDGVVAVGLASGNVSLFQLV